MSWYANKWFIYSMIGAGAGTLGALGGHEKAKRKFVASHLSKDVKKSVEVSLNKFLTKNDCNELAHAEETLQEFDHLRGPAAAVKKSFLAVVKFADKIAEGDGVMNDTQQKKMDKLVKKCREACKKHGVPKKGVLVAG